MSGQGIFIAIEGCDGSGKSTQAKRLAEWLAANSGREVVLTREPGGCPQAEDIRKLLLEGSADRWSPVAETLLFVAARVEHLRTKILPALSRGAIVITDRYIGSTIAYQGIAKNVPIAFIEELHQKACGGLMPDLTLVFDIAPELGVQRSLKRLAVANSAETRFEEMDLSVHHSVRTAFLQRSIKLENHVFVDASKDMDSVFADALGIVTSRLGIKEAA